MVDVPLLLIVITATLVAGLVPITSVEDTVTAWLRVTVSLVPGNPSVPDPVNAVHGVTPGSIFDQSPARVVVMAADHAFEAANRNKIEKSIFTGSPHMLRRMTHNQFRLSPN